MVEELREVATYGLPFVASCFLAYLPVIAESVRAAYQWGSARAHSRQYQATLRALDLVTAGCEGTVISACGIVESTTQSLPPVRLHVPNPRVRSRLARAVSGQIDVFCLRVGDGHLIHVEPSGDVCFEVLAAPKKRADWYDPYVAVCFPQGAHLTVKGHVRRGATPASAAGYRRADGGLVMRGEAGRALLISSRGGGPHERDARRRSALVAGLWALGWLLACAPFHALLVAGSVHVAEVVETQAAEYGSAHEVCWTAVAKLEGSGASMKGYLCERSARGVYSGDRVQALTVDLLPSLQCFGTLPRLGPNYLFLALIGAMIRVVIPLFTWQRVRTFHLRVDAAGNAIPAEARGSG
jgi:hypothetical protein